MKILIGFEASGMVRRAFAALGHDVWSCDIRPAEDGSNRHIQDDIRRVLKMEHWDFLGIFHPPCFRLCNSGVRWLHEPPGKLSADTYPPKIVAAYRTWTRRQRLAFMWSELDKGADLFSVAINNGVPLKCVENPQMHKYAKVRIRNYRPATQHVQPWQFGDPEFKLTGLYLEGLEPLKPTRVLTPPKPGTAKHKAWSRVHYASPGPERWKERSKFFPGIAAAMAQQWVGNA
jgi:hypothetical protein